MRNLPTGAFLAGALLIAGSTGTSGWDFASALRPTTPPPVRAGAPVSVRTEGADGLARLFATYGFRLGAVPAGKRVPRILVSSLPAGLAAMRPVGRKTKLFRKILLPIVLVVNEAIARDRVRLITLKRKLEIGASLTIEENGFLWSLAQEYRVRNGEFDDLLVRVDVIPPSLALAQAIEESGWGTSAYARKGNALFGQEAGLSSANAMAGRIGQRRFKIKTFASLGNRDREHPRPPARARHLRDEPHGPVQLLPLPSHSLAEVQPLHRDLGEGQVLRDPPACELHGEDESAPDGLTRLHHRQAARSGWNRKVGSATTPWRSGPSRRRS